MHLNAYNEPPTIDPFAGVCASGLRFFPKQVEKKRNVFIFFRKFDHLRFSPQYNMIKSRELCFL